MNVTTERNQAATRNEGATPGRYVRVDPSTGDLIISYPLADGSTATLKWRLRNHVVPQVRVSIQKRAEGGYWYQYTIGNGPSATQPIVACLLVITNPTFVTDFRDPQGWKHGTVMRTPDNPGAADYLDPAGYFVNWLPSASADVPGIQPGNKAVFEVGGQAKPGFVRSFHEGFGPGDPTEDLPEPVARELKPFMSLEGETQHFSVIGPAFAMDTPRNMLAGNLLEEVRMLLEHGELSPTSIFVREASRVLTMTRDAAAREPLQVHFATQPAGALEEQLLLAIQIDLESKDSSDR